jgi:non-canonical (house-cleaning) NTP pyrophosphatase
MAKMHLVMTERQSPIARFPSRPFELYETREEAKNRVEELNKKATTNEYWSESVSFIKPKSEQD